MTADTIGSQITKILLDIYEIPWLLSIPDIYVGGIIGAAYMHATDIVLNVNNCSVSGLAVHLFFEFSWFFKIFVEV